MIEGVIRVVIFLLYIVAITCMEDIKRVYMYHGAEHKCINCVEHGLDLNVENVKKSSRFHKRCGTSFFVSGSIYQHFVFCMYPHGLGNLEIFTQDSLSAGDRRSCI